MVAVLTISAAPVGAQDQAIVVFVNATVVDVERGSLVRNQSIVTSRGRIDQVGPAATTRIPRGATRVDLAGMFVIPGLWDMHVHIAGDAPDAEALVGYYGSLFLANGVTGVRDAGGDAARLNAMDSIRKARRSTMPRLIYAGDKLGPEDGQSWSIAQAQAAINSRVRAGAKYVKLVPVYPVDLFKPTLALCAAARLQCVAHVPAADTGNWLSAPGRGSYEHLFNLSEHVSRMPATELFDAYREYERPTLVQRVMYKLRLRRKPEESTALRFAVRDTTKDRAFFSRVASAGTWITPTLILHHHMTEVADLPPSAVDSQLVIKPAAKGQPRTAQQLQGSQSWWKLWTGVFQAMHTAGVHMLAGTDFFDQHVPGAVLHAELALLQQAGMPAAEVLRTATLNPARYFGATDSLGTVAAGRVADLVVLRRNPLEDARHVADIEMVMTRGNLLRRRALDSLTSVARGAVTRLRAQSRPAVP